MRRISYAALALILACRLGSAHPAAAGEGEIEWASSFGTALEQARAEHKIVLVDFYTHWCYWCKVMDANTFTDRNVAALASGIVFVKVNAESEVGIARQYGVRAYPTLVFLNPDGSLRQRIRGYQPPEAMISILKGVQSCDSELAALSLQVRENPADAGMRESYAEILARSGADQEAYAEIDTVLQLLDPPKEERAGLELDRWIYLERAGGRGALKGLERWVKRAKGHARRTEATYFLALAKEQAGKTKDARKLLRRIAKEAPNTWFAQAARQRLAEQS